MKGIIFIALFFAFSFTSSFACSCEELDTKDAFKQSDLIFSGKLIDKQLLDTEINAKQRYTRVAYTFEILSTFKGRKRLSYPELKEWISPGNLNQK